MMIGSREMHVVAMGRVWLAVYISREDMREGRGNFGDSGLGRAEFCFQG